MKMKVDEDSLKKSKGQTYILRREENKNIKTGVKIKCSFVEGVHCLAYNIPSYLQKVEMSHSPISLHLYIVSTLRLLPYLCSLPILKSIF